MESGVIQKTIVAIVLIVLAFIAGSMVADSRTSALMFIGGVAGVAFVIMLGRRCWWLIFLAPPLLNLVPLGIVQRMPVGFAVGGCIMMYWVALTLIGAARMRWRGLGMLDFSLGLVVLLFIYSYVCHPVVVGYFADFDTTEVGGQEYLWCICATIYYVSLSLIPCSRQELDKVLKWSLWIIVVMTVLSTARNVGSSNVAELENNMENERFGMFYGVGKVVVTLIFCRYRIGEILTSPWRLCAVLFGSALVALCGFREEFVGLVCMIVFISLIRREIISVGVLAAIAYGGVLLLSSTGAVKDMPFGIQRFLSIIPGVEVEKHVERGASHSSRWRVVMWRWALDPSTGYIKDYVWGDGFVNDISVDSRDVRLRYRGQNNDSQGQKRFARLGVWHNGAITAVHRIGIVGLVLISLFMLTGLVVVGRACAAYRGNRMQFVYLYFTCDLSARVAQYFLSAGTLPKFFGMMTYIALGKVLYCMAREEGLMRPMFGRGRYVPVLQRPEVRDEGNARRLMVGE